MAIYIFQDATGRELERRTDTDEEMNQLELGDRYTDGAGRTLRIVDERTDRAGKQVVVIWTVVPWLIK